jgi:hypothetical protein
MKGRREAAGFYRRDRAFSVTRRASSNHHRYAWRKIMIPKHIRVGSLAVLAAASLASASVQALTCTAAVDYVRTEQDGTVVDTESYDKEFLVEPGVPFEDDFSTPTRFKLFTASAEQVRNKTIVTMTYFSDVGTFESVDFASRLTLVGARNTETTSGDFTFSTSLEPASGHYSVDYALTCRR